MRTFFLLLASVAAPILSQAAPTTLPLKPEDVIRLVLKQGPQAQEIQLQAQQSRLVLATAERVYDFNAAITTGYFLSKFESPSNSFLEEEKNTTTVASLAKPFSSGTTLTLQYQGISDTTQVRTGGTASDYGQETAGILLEQNLWRNFFGHANRASLRAAEATVQASEVSRWISLQDLALKATQAYWNAYAAQETFEAAVKSRNRYMSLVDSIQKKVRYGFNNPSDLTQAQAELEGREQTVKTESANFLASVDSLKTLLGFQEDSLIQFVIPTQVAAPETPKTALNLESTRALKAATLSVTSATETLEQVKSESAPDISLIAQYYAQGFDGNRSEAQKEMFNGTHPKYYIGLRFQHSFGSGYQDENSLNKRMAKDLAQAQLDRKKLELQDQEEDLKRRLQSTYSIFISSKNQRSLREKASLELSKTYTQGRTDISILIDSLNKYFDSEAQVSRSLADYQITWAQWQALQDQLVTGAN